MAEWSMAVVLKAPARKKESISEVRLDLVSAKILVWIASVGRDAELTAEAHIYFSPVIKS
jgi:hypothetical protein